METNPLAVGSSPNNLKQFSRSLKILNSMMNQISPQRKSPNKRERSNQMNDEFDQIIIVNKYLMRV